MGNLSKLKRGRILEFLNNLREEHKDTVSLLAIKDIELELTNKKFGLVWEDRFTFLKSTILHIYSWE